MDRQISYNERNWSRRVTVVTGVNWRITWEGVGVGGAKSTMVLGTLIYQRVKVERLIRFI
jgi:hypothetical protein